MTPDLLDKRFVFVTGKGGVGKTTLTVALARRAAAEGKRVLVCICNAKDRMSPLFGCAPLGPEISPVGENIWGVNMAPELALEEYGMLALKSRAAYKLLFDNSLVRTFFRAVPGLHEWAMLGKAWWHTTETRADGSFAYDLVILDAPATGHGLDMLRVPKVIVDVVPPGILRRDAEIAWNFFRDKTTTSVVLVTLPEEMPTSETIELAAALTGELGLPVTDVVVNGLLPPIFSAPEGGALSMIPRENPVDGPSALMTAAHDRAAREAMQAAALLRVKRSLPYPVTTVPFQFDALVDPAGIAKVVVAIS